MQTEEIRNQGQIRPGQPSSNQNSKNNRRSFGGGSRNGNKGGKRSFGPSFRESNAQKVNSVSQERPHYFTRNNVDMPDSLNLRPNKLNPISPKGNLGVSGIQAKFTNQYIASNSPKSFDPNLPKVRIIPLGGLNEVGMNMTAIECGDDIIVIDTGFAFGGGEQWPGIDYLVPDTSYLEQNKHKIRAIFYTHGHLDHIGGAPYVLPKLGNAPIFAAELTAAMVKHRLKEFNLEDSFTIKVVPLDAKLSLGRFKIQMFRLNHSIPDTVGLAIDTPMGKIVYCTDWKFDNTPYDNQFSDYAKLAQFGEEGVRLLITDSLGALKPGYSISEKDIEKTVDQLFSQINNRIIFASFASSIARIQHVINVAQKHGRKVALLGRSMVTNFNICFQLGKIKVPSGVIVDIKDANKIPPEKLVILSTGSQGEDMAALSRMSRDEHPNIKLQGGDAVIFSSGIIPGNEDAIQLLKSALSRKGVEAYAKDEFDIHVSGHACQEDLKLMFSLTRPEYVLPIHGEHFMLRKVCELASGVGVETEKCIITENGRVTELLPEIVTATEDVLIDGYVLVDGSGVGSASNIVLEERRQMAKNGTLIMVFLMDKHKKLVANPEIVSRGFVYMKNSQDLFKKAREEGSRVFNNSGLDAKSETYFSDLRKTLKVKLSNFIFEETEKNPVIIPVVVQV